jgi:hypothetical protein
MDSLIRGNRYFFTKDDGINSRGEKIYEIFRAKYLGKFTYDGGFGVSDIQFAGINRMATYTMVTSMKKMEKIESLRDFANFLPDDVLSIIDLYL